MCILLCTHITNNGFTPVLVKIACGTSKALTGKEKKKQTCLLRRFVIDLFLPFGTCEAIHDCVK